MPRATLLRATHMEVLAADPGNRSRAHAHLKRREWLGLLEREMEQHIVAGEEDEAATRGFVITSSDRGIQPCGPLWCRPAEVAEGPLAIDVSAAVKVELIERAVLGLQGCLASPFVHRASDA